ncbi:MAG: hypothetical protein HKL90_13770 [Elusimicrobia bacterium]|nr:hypothetical protein [Elusimicrobiota bacterium]
MISALFAVLAAATPARAQSTATLRGVDVYRSESFDAGAAYRRFGGALDEYVRLRNEGGARAGAKAEALRVKIQSEVAGLPQIAFAELSFSDFFSSDDRALYATFDVVDKADLSRLAFNPEPPGDVPDPAGLLAAWKRYMDLGESLSMSGQMSLDRPNCPGFYCLWSGTPEIDGLEARFKAGAQGESAELRRVLTEDRDGAKRAAALFVLSYSVSGSDVLSLCSGALTDPDPRVRGAALQILSDIANHHPELPVGLLRVLARLDDPATAVRGKAMGLLVPLAERKAYRDVMLSSAPRLVKLLELHQPESRDLAYTLLGIISRKDFDKGDDASWEKWAKRAAAGKP